MVLLRVAILVLLVSVAAGCSLPEVLRTPPKQLDGKLHTHQINHVVIFAIDGLKRDTLLEYLKTAPRKPGGLHDLLGARVDGEGVVFTHAIGVDQAATVFPSYTYPSWTSMFTGVYPGAHGITGNAVFFRDRQLARYYAEYHIDAVRVQLERGFVARDMNEATKTVYEFVEEAGGRSIVVYNMVDRGSDPIKPSPDTLWNYQKNRNLEVDENALWDALHAVEKFNNGRKTQELRLPTVLTIYFSGLDHVEHLTPDHPEKARVAYLGKLDDLIAKFINGDPAVTRHHYKNRKSLPVDVDATDWRGLKDEPVFKHTLFVLGSDHGHTPIDWSNTITIDDLEVIFDELSESGDRFYRLAMPHLVAENWWSKVRGFLGWTLTDHVSRLYNVVATLNGGALGLHIRPDGKAWKVRPEFDEVKPVLEHLLLTLHKNNQAPQAVFFKHDSTYDYIPYKYTGSAIQLLPAVPAEKSPVNDIHHPMAVRRLNGLAASLPTDPMSAPDVILLADRSKRKTYANKQDNRIIETLNVETHRHLHSDHGHLSDLDSYVPIFFAIGNQNGQKPLATLCEGSIVDIAPTLLDILDLLPAYERGLQLHPDAVKGHSFKKAMNAILNGTENGGNVCPPRMLIYEPVKRK